MHRCSGEIISYDFTETNLQLSAAHAQKRPELYFRSNF